MRAILSTNQNTTNADSFQGEYANVYNVYTLYNVQLYMYIRMLDAVKVGTLR